MTLVMMCRFTAHFSILFSMIRNFIPKMVAMPSCNNQCELIHDRSRSTPQAENARYALPLLRRRRRFQGDDWAWWLGALVLVRSMRTSDLAEQSVL